MLRFGTRSFPTRVHECGQMRARVSRLRLLERLPLLSGSSPFELIGKLRAFLGVAGVFVGICAYSPLATAEVEEDTNQEASKSGYGIPALSQELMTNLSVSNMADGEALIPETVWSLDVNSGVHLDRIAGGPGSETNAVFGERVESTVFWSGATLGLWNDNHTDGVSGLSITPLQFQVASCGGSAPERSTLDYCDGNDLKSGQDNDNSSTSGRGKSNTTTQGTDSDVMLSSGASLSSLNIPSNTPPLTSAIADTLPMQGDMTLLGQCDGVSISCAPIHIDPPATPIDSSAPEFPATPIDSTAPESPTPPIDSTAPESPTPPIGNLTPPIDPSPPEVVPPGPPIFGGDPGSGRRPIPEAPTWVMTTIGFSIVVFLFRKKKRGRTNPISVVDVAEI